MVWIWIFLLYWLVLFVACYVVVEYGQTYYYEEKTAGAALRVAGGSLTLALLWTRRSMRAAAPPAVQAWYDQIFTIDGAFLLMMAIVAFVIFTLLFQFHPRHAVYLGPVTALMIGYMASMAADSLTQTGGAATARAAPRLFSKPQRKAAGGGPTAIAAEPSASPAPDSPAPAK